LLITFAGGLALARLLVAVHRRHPHTSARWLT
jgi:hypothetical protein